MLFTKPGDSAPEPSSMLWTHPTAFCRWRLEGVLSSLEWTAEAGGREALAVQRECMSSPDGREPVSPQPQTFQTEQMQLSPNFLASLREGFSKSISDGEGTCLITKANLRTHALCFPAGCVWFPLHLTQTCQGVTFTNPTNCKLRAPAQPPAGWESDEWGLSCPGEEGCFPSGMPAALFITHQSIKPPSRLRLASPALAFTATPRRRLQEALGLC